MSGDVTSHTLGAHPFFLDMQTATREKMCFVGGNIPAKEYDFPHKQFVTSAGDRGLFWTHPLMRNEYYVTLYSLE